MRDDLLRSGDYARKQIYCPSRVVAWSHGSRFALARRLAQMRRGGRLLDYGCGDGTFVAMVHADFREIAGVDVDAGQLAECRRRLGHLPGVQFGRTRDLERDPGHAWDVVTCMEVLEHCLEDERRRVIASIAALLARDGVAIVLATSLGLVEALGNQPARAEAGVERAIAVEAGDCKPIAVAD